jgi:hypothetical protein
MSVNAARTSACATSSQLSGQKLVSARKKSWFQQEGEVGFSQKQKLVSSIEREAGFSKKAGLEQVAVLLF